MQVFKVFFKILRQNIPTLIIYFVITFLTAILFVKMGVMNMTTTEEIKPSIVVENASDSEYAKGLISYLDDKCKIQDVEDDMIEDALYYRQIAYVLYIPEDFENQILSGETLQLDSKSVADISDSYIANQHIESYVSTLQNNIRYSGTNDPDKIIKLTSADLKDEVKVELMNHEMKEQVQFYFNFLCYTFCSCLIGGIGYAMYVMNKRSIRRRNIASPLTNLSTNLQQISAFIVYAIFLGLVAIAFAYLVFPTGMKEAFAPYMIMNVFVSLVPALGLAYLIGTLINSIEVQNGVSNVLCLILAFMGGCFVPQQYMSDALLSAGAFTPNYWFVKANNALYELQVFDFDHLKSIFTYMGIQILFGVVFFLVALIYSKQRRKNVL